MYADELMIGDWVVVNNTPLQIAALGTIKAGFADSKNDLFYHYYDVLRPIPLTSVILSQSGFAGFRRRDKEGMQYTEFATNGLRIDQLADNVFVWICPTTDSGILTIQYVHELQHVLRLCGIETDINL